MQKVIECADAPDKIAYVKFMPESAGESSLRAFAEVELSDVQILTLVHGDADADGWKVWGLSRNYIPSARRVTEGVED